MSQHKTNNNNKTNKGWIEWYQFIRAQEEVDNDGLFHFSYLSLALETFIIFPKIIIPRRPLEFQHIGCFGCGFKGLL